MNGKIFFFTEFKISETERRFFGKRFFKIFCRFGKNFPFFPCREFFLMLALFFVINTDGIRLMWNLPLPLFLFSSSSPLSLPPPASRACLLHLILLTFDIQFFFFFFYLEAKKEFFFLSFLSRLVSRIISSVMISSSSSSSLPAMRISSKKLNLNKTSLLP